ncbi:MULTISPECIES: hypothetical protein [unclassified Streptomyces]|uniref:hypothetical protein n=1 Tax=unclassified Streptomyces TaxID=2593676 RepID=UPI002795618C|nr:hypothetical protein [Streptomyces sp. KL115B]
MECPASPKVHVAKVARSTACGVPDDIGHVEKWQPALDMLDDTRSWGVARSRATTRRPALPVAPTTRTPGGVRWVLFVVMGPSPSRRPPA